MGTNSPNKFWNEIKKLGPSQTQIPMKVYKDNTLTDDIPYVLQTWEKELKNLYNPQVEADKINVKFAHEVLTVKADIENEIADNLFEENYILNSPISIEEITRVCRKLKNKKTPGIDKIPNEVLKHKEIHEALLKLFSFCFENGTVPDIWSKAIIKPIPKNSNKDLYVPLHYRGISLLSCVGKLYTSLLNHRINQYLDVLGIIVEEQNGFRSKRSCEDQIFSLTSIIQHRKASKLDTFAALIDMNKAFDSINRPLLLYKLLRYNIQGKMYNAIKLEGVLALSSLNLSNLKIVVIELMKKRITLLWYQFLVMGQEYGGFNKDGPAEKIYNRALRYFLGVNKFTANLFLQGDSGWLPPKYLFYLSALRYWNKLCQFDNTCIPKQIFNWTFQFKKH